MDVNTNADYEEYDTGLMHAAANGYIDFMQCLMDAEAKVGFCKNDGTNALTRALYRGHA